MFGLSFRFFAGRYHATPWGRNVNEADVAWPPEPWRVIRAFIANYWRKGNWQRWSQDDLARLVHALTEDLPVFKLPIGCVHAHTRHYMPTRKMKKGQPQRTLIFDAFLHIPKGEAIQVIWKDVTLDDNLMLLAEDLASSIGYLGRAESWTECSVLKRWDGSANCGPIEMGFTGEEVSLLVPRSAKSYQIVRDQLLAQEKRRIQAEASKMIPEDGLLSKAKSAFCFKGVDTLPADLVDALSLETTDLQKLRWHRPPAASEIIYARDYSTSPSVVPRSIGKNKLNKGSRQVTVARFTLFGRPRPRMEDAIKIGEVMRAAAMSQFGWRDDELNSTRTPLAPWQISGRSDGRNPIRDPSHPHAFWLPEDADGDGMIDHIIVYISGGIDRLVQSRLNQITRIWLTSPQASRRSGRADGDEWRIVLEGFGCPEDFVGSSRLLGKSKRWRSVTPFLSAGHLKKNGYPGEVLRLLKRQGMATSDIEITELSEISVGPIRRHALHFYRFRSRGRVPQPDASGTFLEIEFPYTVQGPLSIGFASHFGLGMFGAMDT